jgi:hypothetical protein
MLLRQRHPISPAFPTPPAEKKTFSVTKNKLWAIYQIKYMLKLKKIYLLFRIIIQKSRNIMPLSQHNL